MDDYSPVGKQKLEAQARRDLYEVKCPLDSAIMEVVSSKATRCEPEGTSTRDFPGLPRGRDWTVTAVHLQCSACRRLIRDVTVDPTAVPRSRKGQFARSIH
jgi:hypothetical protein